MNLVVLCLGVAYGVSALRQWGVGVSRKGATLRTLKTRAVCELVNEMGVLAGSGALVEDSRQGLKLVSRADR